MLKFQCFSCLRSQQTAGEGPPYVRRPRARRLRGGEAPPSDMPLYTDTIGEVDGEGLRAASGERCATLVSEVSRDMAPATDLPAAPGR